MTQTPEYTRKAIDNYRNKFDVVSVRMPKGTRSRIEAKTSESLNIYINRLIAADLEQTADNLPDFMKD